MSAEPTIDQLYEQQIKALLRAAKLWLLARIADELAGSDEQKTLSIMGLHVVLEIFPWKKRSLSIV